MKDTVTTKKLIETSVKKSEWKFREKLPYPASKNIDLTHLFLRDIVDLAQLKKMLDSLYKISGVGVCIKDQYGAVLIASYWQEVCSCYHCVNPGSKVHCDESDEVLSEEIPFGTYKAFKCANGLWDLSTPIMVEHHRLGKLNIGQFLYDDDDEVDEELIRQRAHAYGFDEETYLEAYRNVPRWSHEKVEDAMEFCIQLTSMISSQGYANLRMAKMLEEQKKLEEILKLEKTKAEAANDAKTQFLANMSHELRTPLNGIMGMTQLLNMTEVNREQKDYIAISLKACTNLTGVVNDILDYTNLELKPEELKEGVFNPQTLLQEVTGLYQAATDQKKIEITYESSPEVPDEVTGDRFKIKQILNNLVGNAVKFTEQGSVLLKLSGKFTTKSDKNMMLEFMVRDTGIGIQPEKVAVIFDSFTQVDSSHTRKYGGLGLGLSIARELAKIMGGNISVESKPGVGSSFYFTCQVKVNAHEYKNRETAMDERHFLMEESHSILVVDDDYSNRWMTQSMLKKEGLMVDTAVNGQDAIDKVKAKRYDVIFMDLQMPLMDGYEATRRIRSLTQHSGGTVPIIAITAAGLPEVREKCLAMGMNDYLLKPIDRVTLIKKLHEWKTV